VTKSVTIRTTSLQNKLHIPTISAARHAKFLQYLHYTGWRKINTLQTAWSCATTVGAAISEATFLISHIRHIEQPDGGRKGNLYTWFRNYSGWSTPNSYVAGNPTLHKS